MAEIRVRLARASDRDQLLAMRVALWPNSSAEEQSRELAPMLEGLSPGILPFVLLVAEGSDGSVAGFLEANLRSHADGCNPSRPVGYVEGWYVAPRYRRRGVGAKLMAAAEEWARAQGCTEIASDTWADNDISQQAHERLGFEVVDRCVHYRKGL